MWLGLEFALILFVIAAAVFVAFARDIVGAIVTFAAFTLGIAVIWVLLAAPDVALIEAAVGAGVTSVLFLITVMKTTGMSGENEATGARRAETDGGNTADADSDGGAFRPINVPALMMVGALAIPLGYVVLSLEPVGAENAPAVVETYADGELTPYGHYIENTLEETGFPNAVVAVLVVYRGLDTLGELIVAFAAAVSILIVLEREDIL
ncbi:monovalent cation/H+ antiporter subunit B [Halobiforma nitratireducens JCM 10879]|uniref:Monovalent cation/H+ antiporter subunit B n=2 Tax=Halobiforma nitratireducens TaxID=130048 RepID=M0M2V8_9EURY|nr:monovalent cation/H+ antiporter subunit B [Halobiforma nitratireducens JCM 10879]